MTVPIASSETVSFTRSVPSFPITAAGDCGVTSCPGAVSYTHLVAVEAVPKSIFEFEREVCVTDTLDEYLGHAFRAYV